MNIRKYIPAVASVVLLVAVSISAYAQGRATLRGSISDEFGASIVGATVTATDANGTQKTATTGPDGGYSFTGLTPGKYKLHAAATGFANSEDTEIDVAAGRRDPVNITLKIAAIETQVKVNADTPVSTDANNNANQQVLSGKDLDALPDDPDDLAAALQALAGPSMGPNGGQIFIDGFSGANLPPKEAIREIRINQNPFSPENDQPSARIDILTRPGTDKFRGSAGFNFTDESLNSRNPFAVSSSKRVPYQQRQLSGSISGPIIKKKASFFLEANRNATDENALISATVLGTDPNFTPTFIGQGVITPIHNMNIGPRLDVALNSRNTLIARYNYSHTTNLTGVGGFNLASRSYTTASTNQNIQLTETAVINASTINETRFQYSHNRNILNGNSTIPALNVSSSFNTGGSQVGQSTTTNKRWELNNFTQMQHGMHTFKFGGRVRGVNINDLSSNNFGGQWVFSGGVGPDLNNPVVGQNFVLTSIERYRRTVLIQQNGLTSAQRTFCGLTTSVSNCIRLLGGGASQFSINQGNSTATVSQTDLGVYWQDDWRMRPNFTFSYGVRYENQTNANSKFNFAPRIAFAWSPGAANATKPPKTVIRGGTGIFYNRFSESYTLNADRFNGSTQQQFAISEQIFFDPTTRQQLLPTLAQLTDPTSPYAALNTFQCLSGGPVNCVAAKPSIAQLAVLPQNQAVYKIASNIQAPAMYLIGAQVERQLPKNITAFVGVSNVRMLHQTRIRDINAPLPGTITAATPLGIRPNPTLGDVDEYESSAKMRLTQMFIGFNSRLNPNVSLSGNYVLSKTLNDSDGGFPVNSYDLSGEWGRASFDIRHRFSLFGNYNAPKLWKLAFSPFVVINSGGPFNITTGQDTNGDRVFNERPTFVQLNAYCTTRADRCTRFDYSKTTNDIIPRNYGNAPGSVSVNLRISRTFGFGGEANRSAAAKQNNQKTTADNSKGGDRGRGGPSMVGGMGGATKVGGPGDGGRGGGGPQMMMMGGPGGASSPQKYNLTVSINANNIFNHVNFSAPVGNLTSPSFGQSLSTGGGFGGFGGFGGGGSSGPNRKVYLNLRLTF